MARRQRRRHSFNDKSEILNILAAGGAGFFVRSCGLCKIKYEQCTSHRARAAMMIYMRRSINRAAGQNILLYNNREQNSTYIGFVSDRERTTKH